MKNTLLLLLLVLAVPARAQMRIFLSAGTNFQSGLYIDGFYQMGKGNYVYTRDGKYSNHHFGKYFNADILAEVRVNKLIYGVTGIMASQVGYRNSFTAGSKNTSEFTCTYLGIPLLIRLNLLKGFLMDIGPVARIPLIADLKETAIVGSAYETSDHQNVARYLTPFSLGWVWQNTFAFNRVTFTFYFMGGKTQVSDRLQNHWNLGTAYNGALRNNSLFLSDMRPRFVYQMLGIKVGLRIR
jgi:hypothetical protein